MIALGFVSMLLSSAQIPPLIAETKKVWISYINNCDDKNIRRGEKDNSQISSRQNDLETYHESCYFCKQTRFEQ